MVLRALVLAWAARATAFARSPGGAKVEWKPGETSTRAQATYVRVI